MALGKATECTVICCGFFFGGGMGWFYGVVFEGVVFCFAST